MRLSEDLENHQCRNFLVHVCFGTCLGASAQEKEVSKPMGLQNGKLEECSAGILVHVYFLIPAWVLMEKISLEMIQTLLLQAGARLHCQESASCDGATGPHAQDGQVEREVSARAHYELAWSANVGGTQTHHCSLSYSFYAWKFQRAPHPPKFSPTP